MTEIKPRLYADPASWWPALSPFHEYAEEAGFFRQALLSATPTPPQSLFELGSGGGSNAYNLKKTFQITLVDLSPDMLDVSRKINPELEHLQGDMRTIRLDRIFDAVFIHDVIMYMATENLIQAIETAYVHCKPGAVALFVPDCVAETFKSYTDHGGQVHCEYDRHVDGLFMCSDWLRFIHEAGFKPGVVSFIHSEVGLLEAFMSIKHSRG